MLTTLRALIRNNKGVAALEYALLAGLIFAAIIGAVAALGPSLSSAFANLGSTILLRDNGT